MTKYKKTMEGGLLGQFKCVLTFKIYSSNLLDVFNAQNFLVPIIVLLFRSAQGQDVKNEQVISDVIEHL